MPNHDGTTKRNTLFAPLFSKKSSFLLSFFTLRVTLVTAKINIAVGRRATRVREKFRFSSPLCFLALSLRIATPLLYHPFLQTTNSKIVDLKNILSLFRAFFTLSGNIYPYTYRDAPMMRAPYFISTFTAKAKPNILNPNRLLNRYSVARYLWEKNFPNEQWLNASLVMTTIC